MNDLGTAGGTLPAQSTPPRDAGMPAPVPFPDVPGTGVDVSGENKANTSFGNNDANKAR